MVIVMGGGAMAIDRGLGCDTALALSLTVTLKLNALPAVVGVPLTTPALRSKLRPGGSAPEETIQLL